jgi:hypothetical protein
VSLEFEGINSFFNLSQEFTIVRVCNFNSGEQILNDSCEEGKIIPQKLGYVRITHGSDEDSILIKVWVSSLEGTGHDQH